MAEEVEQQSLIYEARNKKVVSQKDGESTVRIARFLQPLPKHANQAAGIPNTPLLCEYFISSLRHWPSKVLFKGWKSPQKKWEEWVDRLAEKHGAIWNQTGICDAIMSSIHRVPCNQDLVLGLSEFWCPETNTFVFPWGEATITLEDTMILGGYPAVGDPVTSPLPQELLKIQRELNNQRLQMSRSRAKKAGHCGWLKHFMEEESEFEHVAFLSLWLSRFVFPSLADETIGKHVFPIAAHLSRGTPMAIGPAVLASLYRDLRFLREQAMDSKESIVVSGPFQLLQLWAFEHFPLLGPNSPNLLQPGEPRVARWHKLNLKINLPLVRSALQLAGNFQWRPYAASLENWRHPSYYKETEQLLLSGSSLDGELRSFFKCLQASELVGVDCKEKYQPHRVARQFGMDQDLPADLSGFDFTGEYVSFFVPPRSFQPGASERYIKWWKDMMLARESAIKDVLVQKRYAENLKASSSLQSNGNGECHGSKASTKSSGEGIPSSVIPEFPSKEKIQRLVDSSEDEDFPSTPRANVASSPALRSRGKLSQVSAKSHREQNHESVTPPGIPIENEEQIFHDSSDDDSVPIATRFKLRSSTAKSASSQNVVPSSTFVNENCGKRKLHTTVEGVLQDQKLDKKPVNGVAEEVEGKAGKSTNGSNGITREVKIEVGSSVNEPIDIDELCKEMQRRKEGRESAKVGLTKSNSKQNHDEEQNFQDSSDDDLPIATRLKLRSNIAKSSRNVVPSTSTFVNENCGNRKFHTTVEGILQDKGAKKPVNEPMDVAREVKPEVDSSVNEPIDTVELHEEIQQSKKGRESAKGVAEIGKGTKAGESLYNPVEVDDCMEVATSRIQSFGRELEQRVQKLEKLLGVIPD